MAPAAGADYLSDDDLRDDELELEKELRLPIRLKRPVAAGSLCLAMGRCDAQVLNRIVLMIGMEAHMSGCGTTKITTSLPSTQTTPFTWTR